MSTVEDLKTETASEVVDKAEFKDGQPLVAYSHTEAALAELNKRFNGAKFDLTTPNGDKAARSARLELVTLRTDLEKKRKAFKAPALEFGKKIDAEAARITAEIESLEKPIDAQIRADEARREQERQERVRIEQARVKVHHDAMAGIRSYVAAARGLPAERIQKGIDKLQAMVFGAEAEEFAAQYAEAKAETVAALTALHAETKAREEEAARLEAQRQEQARVAAEQKAEADRLAAERAQAEQDLAAQRAEVERQRKDLERQQADLAAAEAERERKRAQQIEDARLAALAEQRRQDAAAESVRISAAPVNASGPAHLAPQPAPGLEFDASGVLSPKTRPEEPATLKLGTICERLGVTMTAAFVADTLGVKHSATQMTAKLYREADFARICAALAKHAGAMAERHAV